MPLTPIAIKQYIAFLNAPESPATAPIANIKKNTLDGTPVWTYQASPKGWLCTLTGAFPEDKTNTYPSGPGGQGLLGIGYSLPFDYAYTLQRIDNNTVMLNVFKTNDYTNTDPQEVLAVNGNLLVTIEVYNQ